MIYLQLMFLHRKEMAPKTEKLWPCEKNLVEQIHKKLPFTPTGAQVRAIKEIFEALDEPSAAKILLQGDVGAGKSLVSLSACIQVVDRGAQAVVCAPTGILAQQNYDVLMQLIEYLPIDLQPKVAFLDGTTKTADKKFILGAMTSGEINILIGTHSVLNEDIDFYKLGLVVIDEEQKFGLFQRESLLEGKRAPHFIVQSATPIPQTTARVLYGDIHFVTIDELPPGRQKIVTEWVKENPLEITKSAQNSMWIDIASEVEKGHQVFIVTPAVWDSSKLEAANVEKTYKDLQKIFPEYKIASLYGAVAKKTQNEIIDKFRTGETNILVASTLVEVGIDIPKATRMVILSADRMGLSTLHQIRGRIGRSNLKSKCYLVSISNTAMAKSRLDIMVKSNNGMEIANVDLKNRGDGQFFSSKQSGHDTFFFAHLIDYTSLIDISKQMANELYYGKHGKQALHDAEFLFEIKKGNNKK
jgi:ATP-dependent DNA helicase RecG